MAQGQAAADLEEIGDPHVQRTRGFQQRAERPRDIQFMRARRAGPDRQRLACVIHHQARRIGPVDCDADPVRRYADIRQPVKAHRIGRRLQRGIHRARLRLVGGQGQSKIHAGQRQAHGVGGPAALTCKRRRIRRTDRQQIHLPLAAVRQRHLPLRPANRVAARTAKEAQHVQRQRAGRFQQLAVGAA